MSDTIIITSFDAAAEQSSPVAFVFHHSGNIVMTYIGLAYIYDNDEKACTPHG